MARIRLLTRESIGDEELLRRWDSLAPYGPPNLYRALMLSPAIPAMELHLVGVYAASGLHVRARELVILRCAYANRSTYIWHQHVRISRESGLTDDEIFGIASWQSSSLYSAEERALLALVDELATTSRPGEAEWAAAHAGRSDGEMFGLVFLITTYFQFAHVMAAIDLETETPFVGWSI